LGSGSKCVSFLSTLGVNEKIDYVIDINPYRHGKFLPGSGKVIKSPDYIQENSPDITLVMNPIYMVEIKTMIDSMNVNTNIIPLN
jgi:hypothetical protein